MSKNKLAQDLGLDSQSIELSMGMSNDFENAVTKIRVVFYKVFDYSFFLLKKQILMGSANVRVGSLIFGSREKK
jgi:uncharacterized pyridoxal phosphate-containing UPF0001 family protein